MEAIIAFLTPYIPTIVSIFSTVVLIIAGLGKFGTALEKFSKSNEVKELRAQMRKLLADDADLRRLHTEQVAAFKTLSSQIDALLKSDEFLAHREKQDYSEILSLYRQLNLLYSNMIAVDPTLCNCAKDKTEEVKNDGTNNEEAPQ